MKTWKVNRVIQILGVCLEDKHGHFSWIAHSGFKLPRSAEAERAQVGLTMTRLPYGGLYCC